VCRTRTTTGIIIGITTEIGTETTAAGITTIEILCRMGRAARAAACAAKAAETSKETPP
jgi:hypothetical protein